MSEFEGKKIPEWSIFDRVDEIEDITLKLMEKTDITEPTLSKASTMARDALILARNSFVLGFFANFYNSDNPRKGRDNFIQILMEAGLSEEVLKWIEDSLTGTCNIIEKSHEP